MIHHEDHEGKKKFSRKGRGSTRSPQATGAKKNTIFIRETV
jgi:hypothetical protein